MEHYEDNKDFLDAIKESFLSYLKNGSRSTEKLLPLHGYIASRLLQLLGHDYDVLSLGIGNGKELVVPGKYYDKRIDITIRHRDSDNQIVIAGIAVKFIMSNYGQNSNNYFENMIEETANIRSNNILYFQIFLSQEILPHFYQDGSIKAWESLSSHHLDKYYALVNDSPQENKHVPNKTFLGIVQLGHPETSKIKNKEDYARFFNAQEFASTFSEKKYEDSSYLIYNNFERYIQGVALEIKEYVNKIENKKTTTA
ncbi:hypothetical protein EZS27_009801 [termite gut metagenome]|uniref:Uncharacterized protein n=1 Tax=termite gut metagenome TaxID=433724 RepID=A0A5J4SAV5_9ZZZZ